MTQITKENKSIGNTDVSVFLWFIYPKEANKEQRNHGSSCLSCSEKNKKYRLSKVHAGPIPASSPAKLKTIK